MIRKYLFVYLVLYFEITKANSRTCSIYDESGENDRIKYLPGLARQPSFKQFSGYLCGLSGNTNLHYWLVEAKRNPEKSPLLLWLNGGPGCSSLFGLMSINGPFRVTPTEELEYHSHSWNEFANVLYLETPAGVGFSYAKNGNMTTNDDETSLNNYYALKHFIRKFPKYKGREFYIMGESYAAIYVPTLALRLFEHNFTDLKLKGIAVGNGVHNFEFATSSAYYYLYYHGHIEEQLWNKLISSCCADQCATKCSFCGIDEDSCSNECLMTLDAVNRDSFLDPYDIYRRCEVPDTDLMNKFPMFLKRFARSLHLMPEQSYKYNFLTHSFTNRRKVSGVLGCNELEKETAYLNNARVQEAIHVNHPGATITWELCNADENFNYVKQYRETKRQYLELLMRKVPTLLYVGDTDIVCNILGIQWFIEDLGLQMRGSLEPWNYTETDGSTQVGGFYKRGTLGGTSLWYVTVRGAGHSAPATKPVPSYHLITRFIKGLPL